MGLQGFHVILFNNTSALSQRNKAHILNIPCILHFVSKNVESSLSCSCKTFKENSFLFPLHSLYFFSQKIYSYFIYF